MVDKHGVVKILDMGLARVKLPVADALANTQTNLTSAGVIMGTLNYVSPEQALDSRAVDHRTDIYSLGCTLYYLLVGRSIYTGETPMEILVAHRERVVPSLRDARQDVPAELDAIFQRMVAKAAADRFQSMAEVIDALRVAIEPAEERIATAEVVYDPIEVAEQANSDVTSAMVDAVSSAVSKVVSDAVASVVSSVTSSVAPRAATPVHLVDAAPFRSPAPSLVDSGKRTTIVLIGRTTGAVLGIIAGASLGSLLGGLVAIAIILYLWLGWKWGGGYASMFAYQKGWTRVRPESVAGNLFRIEKLRLHAIAISLGAVVGMWTVGTLAGIFIALTVLAIASRSRT